MTHEPGKLQAEWDGEAARARFRKLRGFVRPADEPPLWAGALLAAWFIAAPILALALVLP